jgi:hypothetical protein
MFSIHWLRERRLVEQQTSQSPLLADVVATARASVREVGARHPSNEPESFKVFDRLGRELGHYTLSGG